GRLALGGRTNPAQRHLWRGSSLAAHGTHPGATALALGRPAKQFSVYSHPPLGRRAAGLPSAAAFNHATPSGWAVCFHLEAPRQRPRRPDHSAALHEPPLGGLRTCNFGSACIFQTQAWTSPARTGALSPPSFSSKTVSSFAHPLPLRRGCATACGAAASVR